MNLSTDDQLEARLITIDEYYNSDYSQHMHAPRRLRQFWVWLVTILYLALPISASTARPTSDPAVTYANSKRSGPIAYSEGYFGRGENRLHYVEVGRGPLIILYHGFPSFWYSWFDQMEMLKNRYRVVAVDGLGGGMSAKPKQIDAYKIARLAAQVDQLARHLNGGKRFILMGHDWGAALAFAYAQAYPKRLNAVVGLSAPPYNQFLDLVRNSAGQRQRSAYMQAFQKLTPEMLAGGGIAERIWQQAYSGLIATGSLSQAEADLFRKTLVDPAAMNGGINWYRANIPEFSMISDASYWPDRNAKIRIPALLIWGESDKTFTDDFMTMLPDYAPDVKVVRLPGVNHWTTIERPELANAAIEAFLYANQRYRPTRNRKNR